MASIGDTQTAVLKADIIAEVAQRQLIQSTQLLPSIYDVSRFAVAGAGKASFPKAGNFTVGTFAVPEDSECAVPQPLVYGEDELIFDKHKFVCWSIKDKARMQSMLNVEIDSAQRAAKAHGADLDKVIYEELQASATAVTATGDMLTKLFKLRAALKNNKVPMDGSVFAAINPDQELELLTSASNLLISANNYGNNTPLLTGEVGSIGGIRIVVTTSADDANGPIVYHREALAIGFQQGARLQSDYDVKCLETVYNMDQIYGIKALLGGLAAVKVA
jgi:hypothetical protein